MTKASQAMNTIQSPLLPSGVKLTQVQGAELLKKFLAAVPEGHKSSRRLDNLIEAIRTEMGIAPILAAR